MKSTNYFVKQKNGFSRKKNMLIFLNARFCIEIKATFILQALVLNSDLLLRSHPVALS